MKHAAGTHAFSHIAVVGVYWPHAESVFGTAEKKPRKDLNRRTERTQKSPWPQTINPQIDVRALVSSLSYGRIIIMSRENGPMK